MSTRSTLLAAALATTLAGATTATAQTPVRLYSLIVSDAPGAATPAEGTATRFLTAVTSDFGQNASPLSADVLAISDGAGPNNELTFSGGGTFSQFQDIGRFTGDSRGVLIYDLNLNDTAGFENLSLDLGVNQNNGGGVGVEVFLSYNDAEAGLSLDTDLNSTFVGNGSNIGAQLADTTQFTSIAGPDNTPVANQLIADFSLDAIRSASDDGLLRIAIGVDGFRRDLTILNNPDFASQITGTPEVVPEPSSLSLLGLATLALLRRRSQA